MSENEILMRLDPEPITRRRFMLMTLILNGATWEGALDKVLAAWAAHGSAYMDEERTFAEWESALGGGS